MTRHYEELRRMWNRWRDSRLKRGLAGLTNIPGFARVHTIVFFLGGRKKRALYRHGCHRQQEFSHVAIHCARLKNRFNFKENQRTSTSKEKQKIRIRVTGECETRHLLASIELFLCCVKETRGQVIGKGERQGRSVNFSVIRKGRVTSYSRWLCSTYASTRWEREKWFGWKHSWNISGW